MVRQKNFSHINPSKHTHPWGHMKNSALMHPCRAAKKFQPGHNVFGPGHHVLGPREQRFRPPGATFLAPGAMFLVRNASMPLALYPCFWPRSHALTTNTSFRPDPMIWPREQCFGRGGNALAPEHVLTPIAMF